MTERGNPIAVIQPIGSASRASGPEARLASLAARGLIVLPDRKLRPRRRRARVKGPSVSRAVIEDRR